MDNRINRDCVIVRICKFPVKRLATNELNEVWICTSHAERVNLTTRTLLKRFTRLSLCFSKKLENLAAAVAIYVAYYNFCWQHKTLNGRSPAMAAGVTSRPWSMDELFDRVMQNAE